MGKATMCIQMLQLLNSGKVYKISELADILETNPRNIIEYRKELEYAGYFIEQKTGKYGGYYLDKSKIIPALKFSEDEKKAVVEASSFLRSRSDFPWAKDFDTAVGKIFSSVKNPESELYDLSVIDKRPLAMSSEELLKRFNAINDSIKKERKLNIEYLSNDNEVRSRTIHPYKLFIYNNAWFVIGFCELASDIRVFKINRIERYSLTDKKFRKSLAYNERDYFDENGFKGGADKTGSTKHDDWTHIKLKLKGAPAMYIKEYIYGKSQTITAVDKNTTILECDMQYRSNTLRFVLGFGTDCEVLEPSWLKDEVIKTAKNMMR